MLWKWAWSHGAWRVAGLSLSGVGLWEGAGLRPWACLRSGCAVGSDPAEQWYRLRPKDWRSALCQASRGSHSPKSHGRAEWCPERMDPFWMPYFKSEDPNTDHRSSTPYSFLPPKFYPLLLPSPGLTLEVSTAVTCRLSGEPAEYRTNEVRQTSAPLGRFTDLKCCPVGDGRSSRWSKLGILIITSN